ncbi:MAG: hypothetical protein ACJ77K_13855 [Bacteroidia bacterium]
MKRIYTILTPLLVTAGVVISISFVPRKSGCDSDALYQETLKKLNTFSLLKDYRVYMKNGKKNAPAEVMSFPITLNRGMKYKFFCAESKEYGGKLLFSLYTTRNSKPDFLFATNYIKETGKVFESIEFQSESTVNCVIVFSFQEGKEGCGVGISSFLKD